MKRSFKDFVASKGKAFTEGEDPNQASGNSNWKSSIAKTTLPKGFIPPSNLRPVIEAFLKSKDIMLQNDLSKPVTMPAKTLFLVGGPVRDFLAGKTIKDYDLATNATPEQIYVILAAAGFKHAGDRSGKDGEEISLPKHIQYKGNDDKIPVEDAKDGEKKSFFLKGRDNSEQRKGFVVSAVVNGDEFEIATFRKDAKVTDGAASVDFVDDPTQDAARRDLTINAMYIELNKADGENKTLYDPTGNGHSDLQSGKVRTVGKADERFEEDPLRVMRAIRFHCRFGKGGELDKDIAQAIPKFTNLHERLRGIDRIKKEFLTGLLHPDVDAKKYLGIYKQTGMLKTVFPGLKFDSPSGVPAEFSDKKDKPLALAWLLQHNSIEEVEQALGPSRAIGGEEKQTGWESTERKQITFLLKLKEFSPEKVAEYLKHKEGSGLSNQQIRDWVDMFNVKGTKRNSRPWWSSQVKHFADYQRSVDWNKAQGEHGKCSHCKGAGCQSCGGTGQLQGPQISKKIGELESGNFKQSMDKAKQQ